MKKTKPPVRLTLRDRFAAMAMQGMLSDPKTQIGVKETHSGFVSSLARSAYIYADYMLAARERDK